MGTDNAYRNSNTLGAVLVMKNPVVRSSIDDGDFLDRWFKENQRLFPEIRSAVREHGVWLVTTTYTTKEIALNVWQDKDKVVKLGFSAGIDGIVNLEPSIERGEKRHADGSFTYRAKVCDWCIILGECCALNWLMYRVTKDLSPSSEAFVFIIGATW